jgi:hypothetical protein
MTRRLWMLGSVLLGAAGCLKDEQPKLVSAWPTTGQAEAIQPAAPGTSMKVPPATQQIGARVVCVGDKILKANPQLAMRPAFCTIGTAQPEIFHQASGAAFKNPTVFISEGLVKQCATEGQLAAVLSLEVGKLVSEREAQVPGSLRFADRGPPPELRVGNDYSPTFGSSDGTRYVELAKLERSRQRPEEPPPPPPKPEVLARIYLTQAGYARTDLDDVMPMLLRAGETPGLERQMKAAGP